MFPFRFLQPPNLTPEAGTTVSTAGRGKAGGRRAPRAAKVTGRKSKHIRSPASKVREGTGKQQVNAGEGCGDAEWVWEKPPPVSPCRACKVA